jgi:hypothetical protein
MRKSAVQISLWDIYNGASEAIEQHKPQLISLLEEHIDFDRLIPVSFKLAFYRHMGRKHKYHLESYIRAFVVQKLLGIPRDTLLLSVLRLSAELRDFCGFDKVPDASQLTRFRENYKSYLAEMFEHLVDLTESICREIDAKKADYFIYDTTGIELPVAENNPKFFNSKLREAKKLAKSNPNFDPYKAVYAFLPEASRTNPDARQQYINGHFCYATKVGIVTNGLGICRHIAFFDDDFRKRHPEVCSPRTDNPDSDKEIGDSVSLKPVLSDFRTAHPTIDFKTFIGDSSFDSYDIYAMLKNDFSFVRACIPMNPRNSKTSSAHFDASGTPICPVSGMPFTFLGKSGGKNRSSRFKWVCPGSVQKGSSRVCCCDHPCTDSSYGKCVYTYPDKDFRLYPGVPRATDHWNNLYRHRVAIERTINIFKDSFVLDSGKSHRTVTVKADLFLAGITQLIGVLLADALHKPQFIKSVRRLIA